MSEIGVPLLSVCELSKLRGGKTVNSMTLWSLVLIGGSISQICTKHESLENIKSRTFSVEHDDNLVGSETNCVIPREDMALRNTSLIPSSLDFKSDPVYIWKIKISTDKR